MFVRVLNNFDSNKFHFDNLPRLFWDTLGKIASSKAIDFFTSNKVKGMGKIEKLFLQE